MMYAHKTLYSLVSWHGDDCDNLESQKLKTTEESPLAKLFTI